MQGCDHLPVGIYIKLLLLFTLYIHFSRITLYITQSCTVHLQLMNLAANADIIKNTCKFTGCPGYSDCFSTINSVKVLNFILRDLAAKLIKLASCTMFDSFVPDSYAPYVPMWLKKGL